MNLFDNIFGNPINTFLSEKTPTKKVMSYEKPGYAESVNTSANSPTQGFLYKALSPYEQTAENVTGALQDTAKMYQGVSQDITQWAQNIASNPGLEALGRSWKKKYPDTAKFDDATVGKAVLEKYPEYQYYVDSKQTLLGQGAKVLGGIGSTFASAPGMVAGGTEQLGTGLGTIASAQSGQDVAEGALQAGKGALTAGFGVATGAMPFSSTVLGGISGTDTGGKVLGKLSEYGGIAGQKTAQFLGGNEAVQKQAQGLGEIAGPALALKGVSKGGEIVKPLVKPAIIKTGEVAEGAVKLAQKIPNPLPEGANISTRANRFTAGDEGKFIAQIKETPGEFATSRGMTDVGEKAIEKAQQNFEKSKSEADTAFDAIQGKFTTKGSSNDILGDLLKANKEKMDAQPRNKDSARVNELLSKYESGEGLTMSEINDAKRIHARNHTYSYEQRTSNEARNASDIQNDIRDWQFQTAKENGFTNADKINMETKGWKMYADSLARKMDRSGANNAIGITDWIALSGGNPVNVALFLGKKAASSNLIKTGAIKLFSKKTKPSIIEASKADIQQANFEKNVNRGISGDMNSAGGKSMVKPRALLPAPTGKATGARNFRANQPMEKSPIKNDKQVGERQVKKEAQKLLPAPRLPAGTSLPRTDIVAESMRGVKSKRPEGVKPSPQVKPVEKVETMTKGEAILYRKNGKIYAKDNQATRDALKRSGIDIEPDGEIKKQLTFYPEDDFRPDVAKKTIKPVEKIVKKPTENKIETNITRNEAIEKSFSNSAKARWDKGDFTMKERGEATKYLKSNYKGKDYTIDGKKYKVDAIDNRNEQVRLVDSEGNIIRVRNNKLPETKVTDKDIFDYYNERIQKGYKTVLSPQKTVKPKSLTPKKQSATIGDMETKKLIETAQQWADKLTFKNGERKYDYYTLVRAYNDVLKNGKESGYYKNADAYIRLEMDKLIKMRRSRLQNSRR